MYCVDCKLFKGHVGHFIEGFREAPFCRQCSQRERGFPTPPTTVPIDLVAGMPIEHLSDAQLHELLDYDRCGGIWGKLLAPADQRHFWEIQRFGGTYVLSYFEATGKQEQPRSYWRGMGIQTGSVSQALLSRDIPRAQWRWYPWKHAYEGFLFPMFVTATGEKAVPVYPCFPCTRSPRYTSLGETY